MKKYFLFLFVAFSFFQSQNVLSQNDPGLVVGSLRTIPPVFMGYNANNVFAKDENGAWVTFRNDDLRKAMPQLHATYLRFPAGGKAKSWDWDLGWFLDDEVMITSTLPNNVSPNYIASDCVNFIENEDPPLNGTNYEWNDLSTLKGAWNFSGTSFMIPLNLITSNEEFQLEQVRSAYRLMKKLTVADTVYVELGNEIYNKADPVTKCIFPEPEDYLTAANEYLLKLHDPNLIPGENEVIKVGVVAAPTSVKDKSLILDCHFNTWNSELGLPYVGSGPGQLDLKKGDALIFHIYPESGVTADISTGLPAQTNANADLLFQTAIKTVDAMKNNEMKAVPPGIKAWISEFNLTDEQDKYVRGTWAHGLFVSLEALSFLELKAVDKISCHHLFGNTGRPSIYSGTDGFIWAEKCATLMGLTTGKEKLSAQGLTLSMVAEAIRGSKQAEQINFIEKYPSYIFSNGSCKLYGWRFIKEDGGNNTYYEAVILNLGSEAQSLNPGILFSSPINNIAYETIYQPDGKPWVYVTNQTGIGEAYEVVSCGAASPKNLTISPYAVYTGTAIVLKPYSIVHIVRYNAPGNLTPVKILPSTAVSVCQGENINLFAT
ncbi:MAG: hypothetical protein ABIQ74_04380, partial [Chitinophagales bacterium]